MLVDSDRRPANYYALQFNTKFSATTRGQLSADSSSTETLYCLRQRKAILILLNNCFFFVSDHCDMPLGLEDKRVHNKMMRASSYYNYWCGPWSGRLNGRRHGRYGGAWCAKRRDRHQWLQIDFGALTKVYRIASQGRQNSAQWVKSYSLSYSKNGYKFITYKEGGRTKVSLETVAIMLFRNAPDNRTPRGNSQATVVMKLSRTSNCIGSC